MRVFFNGLIFTEKYCLPEEHQNKATFTYTNHTIKMKKLKQLKKWFYKILAKVTPGKTSTRGAAIALLVVSAILFTIAAITSVTKSKDPWFLLFFAVFVIIIVLSAYFFLWILKKYNRMPKILKLALLIAIPLLFVALAFEGIYVFFAFCIISLIGGVIALFTTNVFSSLSKVKKGIALLCLLVGIIGLISVINGLLPRGFDIKPVLNAAALHKSTVQKIEAPSPAARGDYTVKKITYGSGKDKHRPEFGEDVTLTTNAVNGVSFLDNWEGLSGWYREHFWGFDDKELPLNGYVWYPEGEGPFPLALIVHGNHLMSDFSDVGYEYLGELLASRGIITVSVDQNFLNGSWADITGGLDEENDARGWMLLEHLRVWHEWNKTEDHPFYQKIDTTSVALMGHSRGGEAVGHAAFMNTLPYYSDDASIPLDYNFNIKSIVAIAPVDGQYQPGNAPNELKDVSYLTIHGSQDGDVTSFAGSKQYERITFSDSTSHFKSAVYVQGANHGQFNTSWGENDTSDASTYFLNNKQLLSGEEQREIARVYISAFLETTLTDNMSYKPLFLDARTAADWLPETIYLSQYEDSSFTPLATYDEDFNVTTGTIDSTAIKGTNITVWREQEISLKWGEKGSRAAYVGWHYKDIQDGDPIPDSLVATYEYTFKPEPLDSTMALTFTLSESTENTNPKSSGKWNDNEDEDSLESETEDATENELEKEIEKENETDDKKLEDNIPDAPIDFSIIISNSDGQKVTFCLSDFSALQREIEVRIWKSQFITDDSASENIFQTFMFPFAEIQERNPDFDISSINHLVFLFDKTPEGVIIIDNLGFMKTL